MSGRPDWRRLCCLAALMWGLSGCDWQTDLVALRRITQLCADAAVCADAGPEVEAGSKSSPSCDASDSCVPPEAGCADAASCATPKVVEQCLSRTCAATATLDAVCNQDGLAFALGDSCGSSDQNPEFSFALCSQTDLIVKAPLHVVGSASVDRDLSVSDQLVVDDELRYSGMLSQYGAGQLDATITTAQAQPSCDPMNVLQLDIAASVAAHETDNDNDRAAAELAPLKRWTGQRSITLPCGRYYLTGIDGDGSLEIKAQGNVVLFIDGAISVTQGLQVQAAPSARVTLVVNGSVHVIGGLKLGELSDARHVMLSAGQVHLEQGSNTIGGILDVQSAELLLAMATLDVRGAVFAHRVQLEGATNITHATAAAGASCNP